MRKIILLLLSSLSSAAFCEQITKFISPEYIELEDAVTGDLVELSAFNNIAAPMDARADGTDSQFLIIRVKDRDYRISRADVVISNEKLVEVCPPSVTHASDKITISTKGAGKSCEK